MPIWKKVIAQSNLIKHDTGRAYLVKIPKEKRTFWIPKACVRFSGKSDYKMIISYTDDFEFRLSDGNIMDVYEFESYFDLYETPIHKPQELQLSEIGDGVDESLVD